MEIKELLDSIISLSDGKTYFASKQIRDLGQLEEKTLKTTIESFEYVFIGDNPGKEEVSKPNEVEYFKSEGRAGNNFNKFLKWINIDRSKCLILNKTIKHTDYTEELASNLDYMSQEEIAKLVNELAKFENLKIMLLGFTDLFGKDEDDIFKVFYENLDLNGINGLYRHPSRSQLIPIAEQKQLSGAKPNEKMEYFLYLGQKQLEYRKGLLAKPGFLRDFLKSKKK